MGDRCVTTYKTRNRALAMPVSENDLEVEHRNLANTMRDHLGEHGRELSDTDSFQRAMRSLNAVLEEGLQHARQKNVELWKVHSDEATRCALKKNQAVELPCGLFCLFNKVPTVHKRTSQRHLADCLSLSGAGSRMSVSMQQQVFENWYSKDLARDASTVWNNFY